MDNMNKPDAQSSDDFFNSAEARVAYDHALEFDSAAVPGSLVVAANRLIKRGELSDDYTPEEYAADFMGRV